ncbi:MAG TPA: NAD(P)/FAD-dependent oxidoreductase [bacterium]|nr:NAD(P)/FAD-dependent oxidoreductase [bacterium]
MEATKGNGKTIAIIGGGIAGLTAGCYAQMNGYQATLFESHRLPGGLCTSWKKGDDYTIDGCIQWLVGVAPHSGFHQGWMELGALQGKTIVHHDEYLTFEEADGRSVTLFSDVDKLEAHLLDLSPRDIGPIHWMCETIRLLAKMDRLDFGWADLLLAPLHLFRAARAFLTPIGRFARKFKDPFLRKVFDLGQNMPSMPIGIVLMTLAWHHNRNGGYPVGGSLAFAQSIERRLLGLGGRIQYESKVAGILVKWDEAVGVKLADGQEYYFDRVISACDAHQTFDVLLGGHYNYEKLYRRFEGLKPFNSMVLVSYGVRRELAGEPRSLMLYLDEPLEVGGKPQVRMHVRHYAYDPTLAPKGRTILQVGFETDYDYWKKLHSDPVIYEAEKHALSRAVLERLEKRFPGITGQVEVGDVATPTTFERYTHNWRGSIEGWLPTLGSFFSPLPKTLKSLKKLYFAGHWVQPGGGLPSCLMTGKGIVKKICKEDGRPFVTSLPKAILPSPKTAGPEEGSPSLAEEVFAGRD